MSVPGAVAHSAAMGIGVGVGDFVRGLVDKYRGSRMPLPSLGLVLSTQLNTTGHLGWFHLLCRKLPGTPGFGRDLVVHYLAAWCNVPLGVVGTILRAHAQARHAHAREAQARFYDESLAPSHAPSLADVVKRMYYDGEYNGLVGLNGIEAFFPQLRRDLLCFWTGAFQFALLQQLIRVLTARIIAFGSSSSRQLVTAAVAGALSSVIAGAIRWVYVHAPLSRVDKDSGLIQGFDSGLIQGFSDSFEGLHKQMVEDEKAYQDKFYQELAWYWMQRKMSSPQLTVFGTLEQPHGFERLTVLFQIACFRVRLLMHQIYRTIRAHWRVLGMIPKASISVLFGRIHVAMCYWALHGAVSISTTEVVMKLMSS